MRTILILTAAALWLTSCAPSTAQKTQSESPQESGAPAMDMAATSAPSLPATRAPETNQAKPELPQIQPTQSIPEFPAPAKEQAGHAGEYAAPSATAQSPENLIQPTPVAPVISPQPTVENRLVELEWPVKMRLGDSDIIRLALVPYQEGYIVQAEFPEHQVQAQALKVVQMKGYTLTALARLDGIGFEIQPSGDQRQYLLSGQVQTWRWTVRPRAAGQQRLAVLVLLEWLPEPGNPAQERQATLFSRAIDVRVNSFLGLSQNQAAAGGFLSLLFGSGIGLFALVYRPNPTGKSLKTVHPNTRLVIEPNPGMQLKPDENNLLGALFRRYARVSLIGEFLSGYSGARAFLALPVRPDGRSDACTIVKIGPRSDIHREYRNYETYVRDSLPPMTARIQHAPVTVHSSERAALQYTFIAEPGRLPVSLRLAMRENPDPALLHKLFSSFGPNWWMQREPFVFRLGEEYDRLLPPHLVLQPVAATGKALPVLDTDRSPEGLQLVPGNTLLVPHFSHIEKRPNGISMTLTARPAPGQPPLRVRWLGNTPPDHSPGKVVATRRTLLAEYCQDYDLLGLPDPLQQLEERMNETVTGTKSIIHGDLNLENILVGPGDLVWLIDFSETRFGHPLFDFARLETEIIAHVLAARIGSGRIFLNHLTEGDRLLATVEDIAGKCLFNPNVRREYNLALYTSCLGALKFPNLDRRQKHLLYLTAASLCRDF